MTAAAMPPASSPLALEFPFTGRWMALNSPANRVPSHGTELFGSAYAIDFVAVDERRRSASATWSSLFAAESPDAFRGYGAPILAPVEGTVVAAHDGEDDHVARRSPVTALPYLLSQRARVRLGPAAIAGNHVIVAAAEDGPFVLLAHLRRGSVCVGTGGRVRAGSAVGACGNSGNSTQPHVHVQAIDSLDVATARGLPIAFRRPGGSAWMPRNREVFVV